MQADPSIITALNTALAAELTFHEVVHSYEKIARRWKYKGLIKFFDKQHDKSRCRRRVLEGCLASFNAQMTIIVPPATVSSTAAWVDMLASTEKMAGQLREAFRAGYEIAEDIKGMSPVADVFCHLQEKIEKTLCKLEAFNRQITEQGINNWLSEMM